MTALSAQQPTVDVSGQVAHEELPSLSRDPLLVQVASRVFNRPGLALLTLGGVALSVEIAQYWPETFWGAHATGEVLRNLAYALIGALVFNWVMVTYPDRQRRRKAYAHHQLALQFLATIGVGMLAAPRRAAPQLGLGEIDTWDHAQVARACRETWARDSDAYRTERVIMLRNAVLGVQTALDGLAPSIAFLDEDVALALSQFPAAKGFDQLQTLPADHPEAGRREAHIVWQLIEGARRLVKALDERAPYIDLRIADGSVAFSDGAVLHHRTEDLRRAG